MSDRLLPWPVFATVELAGGDLPEPWDARFPRLVVPGRDITGIAAEPSLRPGADLEAAADRLRERLEPIDPHAWAHDGFWVNFCSDVAVGDYSPDQFGPPAR